MRRCADERLYGFLYIDSCFLRLSFLKLAYEKYRFASFRQRTCPSLQVGPFGVFYPCPSCGGFDNFYPSGDPLCGKRKRVYIRCIVAAAPAVLDFGTFHLDPYRIHAPPLSLSFPASWENPGADLFSLPRSPSCSANGKDQAGNAACAQSAPCSAFLCLFSSTVPDTRIELGTCRHAFLRLSCRLCKL